MNFNGVIFNLYHCACYIDANRFNLGQYDSIMNVQQVPGFRRSYHWKRTVVVMPTFPSLAALTAPSHLSLWEPRVATHDDVIKWKQFPRYSSSSRAGRLGRTLWPQNSTSVAETEKGGQNSTMTPPTLEKGGQYSTSVWKVCKKRGSKIYNSKKYRGQNSTSLKMGVKILHAEKKGSKFYNAWKKGGQYSTSDPKSRGQNST